MAKIQNNFFCSVFTKEDATNIPTMEHLLCGSILRNVEFNPTDVEKKITSLKKTSSSGPDKISTKILQENVKSVSKALSIIFTTVLKETSITGYTTGYQGDTRGQF